MSLKFDQDAVTFEERAEKLKDIARIIDFNKSLVKRAAISADTGTFLLELVHRYQAALVEIARPQYGKIYDPYPMTPAKVARKALGIHHTEIS